MLRIFTGRNGHLALAENFHEIEATGPIWLDLLNPDADEVKLVEAHLGIDIPTRDEMAEIEPSARLYDEDDAEFMTMTAVANIDSDDPVKAPVTFIVKGPTLVTVRHADPSPFRTYPLKFQRVGVAPAMSGESVMLGLIELLIDRAADTLERIGDEADAISREVFRNRSTSASKKTRDLQSLIEQIGRKGDLLTKVRESLVSTARLVAYHSARRPARSAKDSQQRIELIQRDATSLGEHSIFLSGKVNFLLDATLGLINLEQNQIIKIFSVAAVALLPPTLVASIYGMNFDFMPELHWTFGYPWALGLMVLSAVFPYLYFKRRGWL
ncbi:magnesium transporter CorA family protein [Mesorhizobium sp. J428]|uniref:magnesium transporter CorA family protein n=1 Tax=Mesorhizobium sp. J428 TaxID=2898440 RepID=UPI002150F489|nr:magnesium transporter CorA family protein [Mesorhizobium sp. J428]MCR5860507.1 magnesium transporter CorA family protein [Mesorhizobium sp. J428]